MVSVIEGPVNNHFRKARQHNTTRPKQSFFKEKLPWVGFKPTTISFPGDALTNYVHVPWCSILDGISFKNVRLGILALVWPFHDCNVFDDSTCPGDSMLL